MENVETIPVPNTNKPSKNKPTPPKLVKQRTNPFPVMTATKLPATTRSVYGWEELVKPKQFKRFNDEQIVNARSSAYAYAGKHGIKVTVFAAKDENGHIIPKTDDKGNVIMGDNGKPKPAFFDVMRVE